MPLSRVTITIPADLIQAADRRAAELNRSRSWVIVDGLREYLASRAVRADRVAEPETPFTPGLLPSRAAQLEADLRLRPEDRVLLAERTALLSEVMGPTPQRHRVIAFDRHEDFFAWERREALGI